MSSTLTELRQKRLKWVEANQENNFDKGINHLLTELYPDNAHFIYELLQNAEDTEATSVKFELTDQAIKFKHNGKRLFTLKDIESITSIGNSTKRDEATSIGKFGVGFKAVFAYTLTPKIHSGDFHFKIHDLVVPEANIEPILDLMESGYTTQFIFPFDNPKKSPNLAVREIEKGLSNLADNTLLFLNHIREIYYTLPNGHKGAIKRLDRENGRIEILTLHPNESESVSHWLHFQKEVEVTDDDDKNKLCNIAIAYSLIEETNKKDQSTLWKIVPLDHGQVSIYFPAEKETSNLRFHLHAPFASTVARDSVRDCDANHKLRDCIAELVVESLTAIRDQGLLTVSFLAVLPNPEDNLAGSAAFYEPIRKAIIQAFKEEALTPTRSGQHASSDNLYHGPARIAEVINDDDLSLLTNYATPLWVANPPPQSQREEQFLESLGIDTWNWEHLATSISCSYLFDEEREKIENWIIKKKDNWLLRFYALLGEAIYSHKERIYVNDLQIVRVESDIGDKHVNPMKAFFQLEEHDITTPADIMFVKKSVYAGGRSDNQKRFAKLFLEHAGVRDYDEKARIQEVLEKYKNPPQKIEESHYQDIKLFINYYNKNPLDKYLFKDKTILLGISNEDKPCWRKPEDLSLDDPYKNTGLSKLVSIHGKIKLWPDYYKKLDKSQHDFFINFLKATDVMMGLDVISVPLRLNPHRKTLWKDYTGDIRTSVKRISEDYSIADLEKYINLKSTECSLLIWNALINTSTYKAKARYRPNAKFQIREADSQLVYHLKNNAWIPNNQGLFCYPAYMSRDDLPDDFVYNDANRLLTAIGFGENAKKRTEEYKAKDNTAKELGFKDAQTATKWAELEKLGISPDELLAKSKPVEQPEKSVPNPDRRRTGIIERGENAPSKESVKRERSIQPGINSAIAEAKAYLRAIYTNQNNEMTCQCCQSEMPFKVNDDDYYFEAVQCLKFLKNHYVANRLALCPTCAAKYQYARQTNDEAFRTLLTDTPASDDVPAIAFQITLANKPHTIRFVGVHWFDLKTLIEN